jgi:hypothetical protein
MAFSMLFNAFRQEGHSFFIFKQVERHFSQSGCWQQGESKSLMSTFERQITQSGNSILKDIVSLG